MPFSHYAFVVILYSILGWCIESALYSISEKRRVNRGVLLGPWILSYGFGTLALVLISGVIPKNPMLIFASAALLGTVIYYVLWRALAYVIGMNRLPIAEKKTQSYPQVILHALLQGVFGLLIIYVVHPRVAVWFSGFAATYSRPAMSLVIALVGLDLLTSFSHISGMGERLQAFRNLMQEIGSMPFPWYQKEDPIGSFTRLRALLAQETTGHVIEQAILARYDQLQRQLLGGYRFIDAYPNLRITDYDQELHIIESEWELRRTRQWENAKTGARTLWHGAKEDAVSAWERLTFPKLVWIFTVSSVAGFVIETLFCLVTSGTIESRQGMIYGPFSQVYGFGAILMAYLLTPLAKSKNGAVFGAGMGIGGVYEAALSWLQEMIFGSVSWHYPPETFPLFGGRTSLLYMFFWGFLAIAYLRILYPWILGVIERLQLISKRFLTIVMVTFLAFNMAISSLAVFRWTERTHHVPPENKVEAWVDAQYPDDFMKEIYPNMKFR